jgi:hypothetical protein
MLAILFEERVKRPGEDDERVVKLAAVKKGRREPIAAPASSLRSE